MASFSVVSNISASNAQNNLTATSIGLQRSIMRLSSGYRINNAGDDAAGLAVANTYRSTQAVLNQGIRNANDGLSTLQIKDGALNNVGTLLDDSTWPQSASASSSSPGPHRTPSSGGVGESLRHAFRLGRQPSRYSSAMARTAVGRSAPRTRRHSPSRACRLRRRPWPRRRSAPSRRRSGRWAPRRARSAPWRTVSSSPSASPVRRRSATRRRKAGFATPTSRKSRPT